MASTIISVSAASSAAPFIGASLRMEGTRATARMDGIGGMARMAGPFIWAAAMCRLKAE
jgi:hypothetical protein